MICEFVLGKFQLDNSIMSNSINSNFTKSNSTKTNSARSNSARSNSARSNSKKLNSKYKATKTTTTIKNSKTNLFNKDTLAKLLLEEGIVLEISTLDKLWMYHELLRKANPILNLTRIHNFESMVRKHYIDSLIVTKILEEENLKVQGPFMDIGSGAGLPGIPLALFYPNIKFILAETRKNRCEFLNQVIQKLNLENVEVRNLSIHISNCPLVYSIVTRALESMPQTLHRVREGLQEGGLAIFMKGPSCEQEIQEAKNNFSLDYELVLEKNYFLKDDKQLEKQDLRKLVVWKRKKENMNAKSIEILSQFNPRFRFLTQLKESRFIKKEGQGLISGKKIVQEFIASYSKHIHSLILPQNFLLDENQKEFIESDFYKNTNKIILASNLFHEVDFIGTHFPLLLVNVPVLEKWDLSIVALTKKGPSINVFLPLSDPENLGSALRICAAFEPDRIILLQEACYPFHPKSIRASAGFVFDLIYLNSTSIQDKQKTKLFLGPSLSDLPDYKYFALDAKGQSIDSKSLDIKSLEVINLIVGTEGQGLYKLEKSYPLNLQKISIPTTTNIESLNASVALALALYSIRNHWSSI